MLKKISSTLTEARASRQAKTTREPVDNTGVAVTRTKTRIRPAMLITGGALIVCAGLGAGVLTSFSQSADGEVLVTTSAIGAGKQISATSLTSTRMQVPAGVTAFSPTDIASVIQMLASAQLAPGTVLTSANVSTDRLVPTGKTVVGVPLDAGRMPGIPLVAGDPVRLVEVPDKTTIIVSNTARSFKAEVFSVDAPATNAMTTTTIVNVLVAQADANDLAALAASGRIALVIDSIAQK